MNLRTLFSVAIFSVFAFFNISSMVSAANTACPGAYASVTLTWTSTGATTCSSVSSTGPALSGCQYTSAPAPLNSSTVLSVLSGSTCNASITCSNGGGPASMTAAPFTVTVVNGASCCNTGSQVGLTVWNGSACVAPTPAPTVSVTWNGLTSGATIVAGGGATVAWTSTGSPTSCTVAFSGTSATAAGGAGGPYTFAGGTHSQLLSPLAVGTVIATVVCTNGSLTGTNSSTLTVTPLACNLPWGGTVASGGTATAYSTASVPYGSTCTSQVRTCTNGTLSGTFTNQTCTVAAGAVCALPWGGSIATGASATAYSTLTVPYGSTCTSQSRLCTNGTLSGTYTNQTCTVTPGAACTLPWGGSIATGASATAYLSATVISPATCTSQARVCTNGTLSGTYTNQTCSVTTDTCGTASNSTPVSAHPVANMCSIGALNATSPADTALAWNWSCGSNTSCSAPKFGCNTTTDTNYNASGPANTWGCALTCANGSATYPSCPLPNLTAGPVTPVTTVMGVPTTFSSTISNIGTSATGATFTNFLQVASAPAGGGTITDLVGTSMSALAVGASAVTSKSYTFPSFGVYSMRACADKSSSASAGTISELNEGDNCGGWTSINVTTSSCTIGPFTLLNGQSTTTYSIASGDCAANSQIRTCTNGVLSGTFAITTCVTPTPTATISVNPATISYNKTSTLTWTSTLSTSCTAGGPWSNLTPPTGNSLNGSGGTGVLSANQTYTIQCSGVGGTSPLMSTSVTVCPVTLPAWNTSINTCQAAPTATVVLTGNFTATGNIAVTCTDSNSLTINKDGVPFIPTPAIVGAGPASFPVTVGGNYQAVCTYTNLNGEVVSGYKTVAYSPTPPDAIVSLKASPSTITKGGTSVLSWIVQYPGSIQLIPSVCTLTAKAVCGGGHANCNATQLTAETNLQTIIDTGSTDTGDLAGSRLISGTTSALNSVVTPITGVASTISWSNNYKAEGKKTFILTNPMDFLLDCHGVSNTSSSTVRVLVTNPNEG